MMIYSPAEATISRYSQFLLEKYPLFHFLYTNIRNETKMTGNKGFTHTPELATRGSLTAGQVNDGVIQVDRHSFGPSALHA